MSKLILIALVVLAGPAQADSVQGFCERDGKRITFSDGIAFIDARDAEGVVTTAIYLTGGPLGDHCQVRGAIRPVDPSAPDITFDGPDHLVMELRPVALKRALSNLVGNALKYGDAARLTLERREKGAVLLLDDDGPGIPEASQETVFQPFQRIESSRNRETGGTGLGLTIARSILRAHGGDVTLHNRPDEGLRVVIRLPG